MDIAVSIIIVNYNTEEVLSECLSSVVKNTAIPYEIIIIDNASREGSLSGLIATFPQVQFRLLDENLGFGKANNLAAQIAKGKYLYILNPDTILVNDASSILYQYMENHPETGICGGAMYTEEMELMSCYCDKDMLRLEYEILFNLRKYYKGINYTDKPKKVKAVSGANFFLKKSLFLEMGGFDKDFFMYFEEIELCDRIRKRNFDIVSVPQAQIIHLHGVSAENKNEESGKWAREEHWYSKFIYFSKTKGKLRTQILYTLHNIKFQLALFIYKRKKNAGKIEYWNSKRIIMKNAYSRYKTYLKKKR